MRACLTDAQPDVAAFENALPAGSAQWRCLMLLPEFPPKNTAGVHRSLRFCQFLPEFGWHATVLASNVSEAGGDKLLEKVPDTTTVRRVGPLAMATANTAETAETAPRRPAVYAALRRMLSPARQLLTETPDRNVAWSRLARKEASEFLRENAVDMLYTSGPPHSIHLAALKLSRAFGIPWVADFRDPWARKPWTKKANPLGQYLLPLFERSVIRHATKVVLNTQGSYQDFQAAYPEYAQKFHCIPNGLDPELVERVRDIASAKKPRRPIPVLCHPGSMYGHRDPAPVLRAIARLHAEGLSIKLQQIGPISEEFQAQQLAQQLGIAHLFEQIPSLSHDQTLVEMSRADLLLIIQPDAPLMVPSKAYEMLAFDQPIVAACDSAGTEAVVREGGGFAAASRDEVKIAAMLQEAWSSKSDPRRARQRERAREKFDGRKLTEKLAAVMADALPAAAAAKASPAARTGWSR